ncbi:nuclease, Rad2 family [Baffinella frigidus]|nr:nuclease, Rad2 family [Cryptophyta sp. CCMP2293]
MGIKQLTKMIGDSAPDAIKEQAIGAYFGRKVAVDASMSIYQFLIAMQSRDGTVMMTNEAGENTGPLNGIMHRTAKMLESGIKPVYVFDGKPPELKSATIADRREKRDEADKAMEKAREEGDDAAVEKFSKRNMRVTKEMTEDVKTMLRLMGVPVVEAPTEAEAQCAELAKKGLVYAAVSEDMDTLTFGAPVMLRNVFAPESRKLPILEITLSKVLEGLELNIDQFVDLCILMGCDYCGTIRGIGPKTAQTLMQKHGTMEKVIASVDVEKHPLPDPFNHEEIHKFFITPEVTDSATLEADGIMVWKDCDEAAFKKFMVEEKQFDEKRIQAVIERIKKSRGTNTQQRLDGFFKVLPNTNPSAKKPTPKDMKGKSMTGKTSHGGKGGKSGISKKK